MDIDAAGLALEPAVNYTLLYRRFVYCCFILLSEMRGLDGGHAAS